jgi:hypothetical protein
MAASLYQTRLCVRNVRLKITVFWGMAAHKFVGISPPFLHPPPVLSSERVPYMKEKVTVKQRLLKFGHGT